MSIKTTTVRPTTTGVRNGYDVGVVVDGIEGEATVAPDAVNGGFAVYGPAVDFWLSGNLVKLHGRDTVTLREIAEAACRAARLAALDARIAEGSGDE